MINVPLVLTCFRLFLSPLVMPLLGYYGCVYGGIAYFLNIIFYSAFALSDFFDGYLARRWHQESALGKSLDPLADKVFVFSCLIRLVACNVLWVGWAIIIVLREIVVTVCRLIARLKGAVIPVLLWGKIKTVIQLILLAVLFVFHHDPRISLYVNTLIFFAIISTVVSGLVYVWHGVLIICKKAS
jgi:CDP-diacylglycerol---glycerol-3-phosphate 3-phosphatidyltransferase